MRYDPKDLYQDNEASPYLAAVVYHYYLKKESANTVSSTFFKMIKADTTPWNLKRDLIRDITTWCKDDDVAVRELGSLDYESDKNLWLVGQYGVAKLIRSVHRTDTERRAQLEAQAEACLDNNIARLVTDFDEDQKANWAAKTLCSYRKVLGARFDKTLVEALRNDKGNRLRKLSLLDQTCGWGDGSQDVAGYVRKIENELTASGGDPAQERIVRKLLKIHNQATE